MCAAICANFFRHLKMAASSVEAREHAQNLIAKKDGMEAEIKALFEVLESVSELFSLC